VDCVSL